MKNFLYYFIWGITIASSTCFVYFLLKSDDLPDTETKVNEAYALSNMKEAYKRARPTDTLSALNPEQATV